MLRAVIFDFNGVILDDEPVHMMMFQRILNEEGIALSQEDYYAHYLGMDDKGCFRAVYEAHGKKLNQKKCDELIQRKSKEYDSYIAEHMDFFPGAAKIVKSAKEEYLTGIVSGALKHEIEFGLKKAQLSKHVDIIIAQEDVTEGKPSPEGYLKALESLNKSIQKKGKLVLAAECLVIEDSVEGIHSAKEAGMKVAAVAHTFAAEILTPEADWVFDQIGAVSLDEIKAHF